MYALIACNSRQFYLIAFFLLLQNLSTIGYQVTDLASCLDHFDTLNNMIIRTWESQTIGGKYLQGLDSLSLSECRRLCCETEGCNVFVLEEKNERYCYLFECGPPDSFRCKFAPYSNYTSAVLTPAKQATVAPPQPKISSPILLPPHPPQMPVSLSQHEMELRNLKPKVETDTVNTKLIATLIPPLGVRLEESPVTTKSILLKAATCGRFQFQCHSGECIAVYNACDGIPQCEDGSDEGAECPASSSLGGKILAQDIKNAEITNSPLANYNRGSSQETSINKQFQQFQQQPQSQKMQLPLINNREDPMSSPSSWQNRKIPDNMQQQQDRASRIFNHKGGLQIPSNNYAQQSYQLQNVYNPNQRDMFMQPDLSDPYRNVLQPQDHIVVPNLNWQSQIPNQQQIFTVPGGQYVVPPPLEVEQEMKHAPMSQVQMNTFPVQLQQPQQPQPPPAVNEVTHQLQQQDNLLPVPKIEPKKEQNVKNDHKTTVNSGESDEYEDDDYDDKSTEPPKKKSRKHKKIAKDKEKSKSSQQPSTPVPVAIVDSPVHEQYKMIKNHLEMEFRDHDGQSDRPGGAVLSLTLGVIVTAALAILIGCRMRTVGRRVRRRGKAPYAHDADFLVNGMYL